MSNTKIVATLGPKTSDTKTIAKLLKAGASVLRLNMSHGTHESHKELVDAVHKASKLARMPAAILQDLGGPKIRIGDFSSETVTLAPGKPFTLTTKLETGTAERVSVNYARLPREVEPGMMILLNDGKLALSVISRTKTDIHTKVLVGGMIRGRRGVNVPDADLSIATITEKDRADIAFGRTVGADFITLSFVRSADDVHELRSILGAHAKNVGIIAKIETRGAVEHIEAIADAADALLVARGDLAIEIPREEVPIVQKRIIRTANRAGKPVITATQMLDSMRENPVPTRAEVNDIANAILDGTDAVMLSDETAVGLYPEEAVTVMRRVAEATESCATFAETRARWDFEPQNEVDAVSRAIVRTAEAVKAKAIVAFSESGYTGRLVARYRPTTPIIVLTPSERTFNQSLLTYGCRAALVPNVKRLTDALKIVRVSLKVHGAAKRGDLVVVGAGLPLGKPGATNMMLVERL